MRFAIAGLLFLWMANAADAKLLAGPEFSSMTVDEHNPDVICLRLKYWKGTVALSTNGGLSFDAVEEHKIPAGMITNLSVGARRYVLADRAWVFRSDDGGVTWTNTAAISFLRARSKAAEERTEKRFRDEYGHRLPARSIFWHPLFGLFAGSYFMLTFFALRAAGWLRALWTGLRGLLIIFLVWCLLWGFHSVIRQWTDTQYPFAYWNTSAQMNPSPKLGLVMAIAAQPLLLLVYLLALWPLLPGSFSVMSGHASASTPTRRRVLRAVAVAFGAIFVVFHVCMMFVGYFWEAY